MENPITMITQRHKIFRKELARQTNIPYGTLNVLVAGGVVAPSYQTAKKLCHYLEITPGQFIDEYTKWKQSLQTQIVLSDSHTQDY